MTSPQHATLPVLFRLLDANRGIASSGQFSNHLPMALAALYRLGAGIAQLESFDRFYQKAESSDLSAVAKHAESPRPVNRFSVLSLHFEQRVAHEGACAVMAELFTNMPFAPATGAFHALIRIAHGLDVGHAGEIAAGLAAYIDGHMPLENGPTRPATATGVAAQLAKMSPMLSDIEVKGDFIIRHLSTVANDARFAEALTMPPASADLLQELAHAAIALYATTQDFTALHLVTGLHAVRTVFDHLPVALGRSLLPAVWRAFVCAWASFGAPVVPDLPRLDDAALLPWPTLFALAIDSNNDHCIKLTWAAWSENAASYSPWYQWAISNMMRRRAERGSVANTQILLAHVAA